MKIVLATPIFPPESGGPGTYACAIAERLSPQHEVVIITYSDKPAPFSYARVVAIKKSHPVVVRWFLYTKALLAELRSADLVYAQNAVASGFPSVIAGWLRRKPVIIKIVGDEAWERARASGRTAKNLHEFLKAPEGGIRTSLIMAIERFALRNAAFVTAPSASLLNEVTRAYRLSPKKIAVNFNASDEVPVQDGVRKKHQIASVSRLVAWKHIDGLIRAVSNIVTEFPDAVLHIAGEGPEEGSLKTLAAELGVEKNIVFHGNLAAVDVRKLFAESEVYVLNSSYEGMPHTVLESFATHTPVIATNIPGTDEVITNDTGFLVPIGRDDILASTIIDIFRDPKDAKERAGRAHAFFKSHFSWGRHMATLETFLTRVTKES